MDRLEHLLIRSEKQIGKTLNTVWKETHQSIPSLNTENLEYAWAEAKTQKQRIKKLVANCVKRAKEAYILLVLVNCDGC